jgi:hypothetical protein|tara:strand:+ start:465 stop:776 length:312 start_codon:yes stop_codon:yes gene_type:complete
MLAKKNFPGRQLVCSIQNENTSTCIQAGPIGSFLLQAPDLVIPDLHAPRSFTIVDIKVVDPVAASYVDMPSKSALHTGTEPWRLPAPATILWIIPAPPPLVLA